MSNDDDSILDETIFGSPESESDDTSQILTSQNVNTTVHNSRNSNLVTSQISSSGSNSQSSHTEMINISTSQKQSNSNKPRHNHKSFVRKDRLKNQGYSSEIVKRICGPQRDSTRKQYSIKVREFHRWAKLNRVSISRPHSADFCNFFKFKSVTQCPKSIINYRTALYNYYSPKVVSSQARENISRLIRSFQTDRPVSLDRTPNWDLNLVLNSLRKAPYEPAEDSDFLHLTYKTIFLVAFASGKRRSEIHAMTKFIRMGATSADGTKHLNIPIALNFLAKNVKQNASGETLQPVVIPSLDGILGPDLMASTDGLLCPVRMVHIYLERAQTFRGNRIKLFISQSLSNKVCKNTISNWIARAIELAYKDPNRSVDPTAGDPYFTAHSVRSYSASWAIKGCASMFKIMQACHWKSQSTFTTHYLRDCWTSSDGSSFTIQPLVAAGQVIP